MRLRDRQRLDPEAERELEAVERALAGEPVEDDLAAWAELAELLRDERPEPEPGWTAELDEAAAARFSGSGGGSSIGALAARLGALLPRRLTPAVAGLATLAVVAVVAAMTLPSGESDQGPIAVGGVDATSPGDAGTVQAPATSGGGAVTPAEVAPEASAYDSGAGRQGPISPGTANRKQDRDVTLELAAPPDDVNDVSDEAIAITRDLDGIVASSNVTTAGENASATLALVIPTRNLDAAIDRLTEIADVRSLGESTVDITHPYVTAKDRLADAEAERRELLEALGNAATDAEAEALRLQIADARREIARARAAFERISRRAQLSELSLTITGDLNAGSADDDRTLGGWFDDALSVLRDVTGVLLISAAILVPLGILAALAWLVLGRLLRRRRERGLDE